MPIFTISRGKLTEIKESTIDKEKDVQKLIEENLKTVFGLDFVASEFSLNDLRVDTLGFDHEAKSFVIIEYKRKENFSVIDQGYAYLSLLLNNKAEFVLKYNETAVKPLRKDEIDWSQSRVIFVSPVFTNYQRQAINFRDLPIELWEVKYYANGTILFNQIQTPEKSESINKVSQRSEVVKTVSKEVKIATEEMHLDMGDEDRKSLYRELKDAVLAIGSDISVKPKVKYIAFVHKTNFMDVVIYRSQLNIFINMTRGALNDPKKLAEDVKDKGHWGNGDYVVKLKDATELGYILSLVRQSYEKN